LALLAINGPPASFTGQYLFAMLGRQVAQAIEAARLSPVRSSAASMQRFPGIIESICRYYFDLLSGLR
jgi:hypothetical protein